MLGDPLSRHTRPSHPAYAMRPSAGSCRFGRICPDCASCARGCLPFLTDLICAVPVGERRRAYAWSYGRVPESSSVTPTPSAETIAVKRPRLGVLRSCSRWHCCIKPSHQAPAANLPARSASSQPSMGPSGLFDIIHAARDGVLDRPDRKSSCAVIVQTLNATVPS